MNKLRSNNNQNEWNYYKAHYTSHLWFNIRNLFGSMIYNSIKGLFSYIIRFYIFNPFRLIIKNQDKCHV